MTQSAATGVVSAVSFPVLTGRECACGCGETGEREFLPGHEIRAIQARIRARFGGSPLRFIQWLDAQVDANGLRDATVRNAR